MRTRRVLKSFGALSLKAGRVIGANAPAPGAAQNTADARTRLGPQGPQEGSADSNLPRAGRSGDGQGTGSSRITNSRLRHAQPSAREQEEIMMLLILIATLAIALLAQAHVKRKYARQSRTLTRSGYTGAEVANRTP